MDGECMDQSCAWKQPCEYVVAATMTSHHDLITLTAMYIISTIVITINTTSTCTATTITITYTEYLFTSTISPCHMSPYIFITLTAMTTNLTISRYSHWHHINHEQNENENKCFNSSHQKNGRCVLSPWLRNGHVHARLRGKKIIKMATKS